MGLNAIFNHSFLCLHYSFFYREYLQLFSLTNSLIAFLLGNPADSGIEFLSTSRVIRRREAGSGEATIAFETNIYGKPRKCLLCLSFGNGVAMLLALWLNLPLLAALFYEVVGCFIF